MDNYIKGMTVNERLYISGLMEKFDKAVEEKDVSKVISLLKKVEITDEFLIKVILEKIGLVEKTP